MLEVVLAITNRFHKPMLAQSGTKTEMRVKRKEFAIKHQEDFGVLTPKYWSGPGMGGREILTPLRELIQDFDIPYKGDDFLVWCTGDEIIFTLFVFLDSI